MTLPTLVTRKPMVRTGLRAAGRQRKCAVCREAFTGNPMQTVCGVLCAIKRGQAVTAKQKTAARKVERAADRVKRESLKTRSEWMKEAQTAFNAFIRMRDQVAGHACISSGRPLDWSGNAVDAGHYRSVGSAPHLRFHEDNVHAQSKHDNQYKGGNAVDYRFGLIARIGLARVEALEADQAPRRYTVDDLKALKAEYVGKLKKLKEAACP